MTVSSPSPKSYNSLVSRIIKNSNQKHSFRTKKAVVGKFFMKLKQKILMANENVQQKSEKNELFSVNYVSRSYWKIDVCYRFTGSLLTPSRVLINSSREGKAQDLEGFRVASH